MQIYYKKEHLRKSSSIFSMVFYQFPCKRFINFHRGDFFQDGIYKQKSIRTSSNRYYRL